jgi:hypothetical protein
MEGWISVLVERPPIDFRVDVMVVDPTGQNTPLFTCTDYRTRQGNSYDWAIYNDYDCRVVFWRRMECLSKREQRSIEFSNALRKTVEHLKHLENLEGSKARVESEKGIKGLFKKYFNRKKHED